MAVSLAKVDRAAGLAVFAAILSSQSWIHRKVESLHMLEGDTGRRQVSIDCTPPGDDRLAVPVRHHHGHGSRQVFLPIAILAKVQIRDLDVRDETGAAVPMAERETFEWLEVSALVALIEQKGNIVGESLLADLNTIVRSKPDRARSVAAELLDGRRSYDGFDVDTLPGSVKRFIMDMSVGFLLVVVIPESRHGQRFLLKYSTYWPQPRARSVEWRRPLWSLRHTIALYLRRVGWFPFHYTIDVSGAAFASSYHIEVHIPPSLGYDRMELPRTDRDSSRVDIDQGSVAHGGAHYTTSATEDAVLVLRNPSSGRLGTVLASGVVTILVLTALAWTPLLATVTGDQSSLQNALGLLLLVPAGLIALGSRNRENLVAASASIALRGTSVVLAACYLMLAAALIALPGDANRPTLTALITALWVLTLLVVTPVLIGFLRTLRREASYRRSPHPDTIPNYHRTKPQASRLWKRFGVEEPIFRVDTVESGLTVLGDIPSFRSADFAEAAARSRELTERVLARYREVADPSHRAPERDRDVAAIATAEVRASAAPVHLVGRTDSGSIFPTVADNERTELFIGHVKGRRVYPPTEIADLIVGVCAPLGSLVRPPEAWMTVVVVRGELLGYTDPKVSLVEFLHRISTRSGLEPAQLDILVPEGEINDRVVRNVREFGATRTIPDRAAVLSAIDLMTGVSSSHAFYGTVGTSEGMAIAAAARILGAEMFGSFGSPDLLFASGGIGSYSGFYRATELVDSETVSLAIASGRETDLLESGMNFPERSSSLSESSVIVLGAEHYSRPLVDAVVGATDAAAKASQAWIGKRDKFAVDAAAVAAMREVLHTAPFDGTVVIGEGEKDRAPMLANGERLGTGVEPRCDVAVDPLDGTRLAAEGIPGSICVIALAPRGSMYNPRDVFYMDKLITSSEGAGVVDIRRSATENLAALAKAKGVSVADLTVVVLDKPRHRDLIAEIRNAGARVRLVGEGDVAVAVAAATPGTDVDLVLGIGGTPEGIVSACAVIALGGVMQGRLAPQSPEQEAMALAAGHDLDRVFELHDLVSSREVLFVSSPVS